MIFITTIRAMIIIIIIIIAPPRRRPCPRRPRRGAMGRATVSFQNFMFVFAA